MTQTVFTPCAKGETDSKEVKKVSKLIKSDTSMPACSFPSSMATSSEILVQSREPISCMDAEQM